MRSIARMDGLLLVGDAFRGFHGSRIFLGRHAGVEERGDGGRCHRFMKAIVAGDLSPARFFRTMPHLPAAKEWRICASWCMRFA